MIFLMRIKMWRQFVDVRGQDCDLYLGCSRVSRSLAVFLCERCLLVFCYRHCISSGIVTLWLYSVRGHIMILALEADAFFFVESHLLDKLIHAFKF